MKYTTYECRWFFELPQTGDDALNRHNHISHLRLRLVLAGTGILLVLGLLFLGVRWLETRNAQPETRGNPDQRYQYEDLLTLDGVTYRPRDLCTILLMGIDRSSTAAVSGYRNGGQADFLQLIVIDQAAKTVHRLQIDRDTMTPITVLGVLGNKSGIRTAQVSLSHGFGDGQAQSCGFTADAVSNLLFGFPIDFYVAMNLDGISVLNDIVGGVTVTLADDFSALDPAMTAGKTLTLQGDQAEYYVRSRLNIGIGTNEARMARQEAYIASMTELLTARIAQSKDFIGELYDQLNPYLITNMSRGRIINEAWAARSYQRMPLIRPAGEHTVGSDGFMQFYPDETLLQQTVLTLRYEAMK